ncbi:MAG: protein-L-isoaspartate(D-aspartate) O-methyltransferase [Nitrospirota bacterium]
MVESQLKARGIKDERVLDAMRKVPRHLFIDECLWDRAYDDNALPLIEGQTISQPYMVALMTELLELKGEERTLEIGTGSGYQAAVLAELAKEVYTIERIALLSMRAQKVLEALGYKNIFFKIANGTYGWKENAPFDAIMVTAGTPDTPKTLEEQLKIGGRLVVPVGDRYSQMLFKVVRTIWGFEKIPITGCIFVPLVGDFGWKKEDI